MTQWRAQSTPGVFSVDAADSFYSIWGRVDRPTESEAELKAYTGFTFSDLRVQVGQLDDTGNCHFRDDGTSSTNVVVTLAAASWVEDVTGSEAVAADSLVCIFAENTGMHGDFMTITDSLITFEHASTNAPVTATDIVANADSYNGIAPNGLTSATEADVQTRIKRSQTVSNLRVNDVGGGDYVVSVRVNGVTSTNLTVTTSGVGTYEDTTGSDSFSAEDDGGIFLDRTGGILNGLCQLDLDTAEAWWGTKSESFTTREYQGFSFNEGNTTADDNYTAHMGSTTAGNLQTFVTTAGSGTRDVTLRVASSDSTNLTIAITGTGLFEDTTGSEAIADTDNVTASMASTGDTVTVSRSAVELPFSTIGEVAAGTTYDMRMYPRGHLRGIMRGVLGLAA